MPDPFIKAAKWLKTWPGAIIATLAFGGSVLAFGGDVAAVWQAPEAIAEVRIEMLAQETLRTAQNDSIHDQLETIQTVQDRQLFILCDLADIPAIECTGDGR